MDLVFPSATAPPPPPPLTSPGPSGPANPGSPGSPGNGANADDRSTTFRPVEGGDQLQSGEKLLVEAYAAIWLILFALVLASWRKQRSVDDRIGSLETSLARARAADDARRAAAADVSSNPKTES